MGYGRRSVGCRVLDHDRFRFYDLSIFDENDNIQHCRKLLIIFGSRVGFRGNKEHRQLERHHIGSGVFPPDHPIFPGVEWWGLVSWGPFKNEVLGMNQSYLFELETHCRFPVLDNDPANDAGGPIKRWCMKIDALDEEFRKKGKGDKLKNTFYRRVWKNKIYPTHVLGYHKVRDHFAGAFFQMGITNWEQLRPHATRSWFITTLADAPGVNHQEVRQAARHKNASTTLEYMSRGDHSETSRILALTKNFKGSSEGVESSVSSAVRSELVSQAKGTDDVGDGGIEKNKDETVVAQRKDVVCAEEMDKKMPACAPAPQDAPHSSDDDDGGATVSFQIDVPPEGKPTPENVASTPVHVVSSPYTPIALNGRARSQRIEAPPQRPFAMSPFASRSNFRGSLESPDYSHLSSTLTQYPRQNQSSELALEAEDNEGFSSHTQADYAFLNERLQQLETARARNDRRSDAIRRLEERNNANNGPSSRQLQIQAMTRRVNALVDGEGRRARELRRMEERLIAASSPYKNERHEEEDLVREYLEEEEEREERRRIEYERNEQYRRRRRHEELMGEDWVRRQRQRHIQRYREAQISLDHRVRLERTRQLIGGVQERQQNSTDEYDVYDPRSHGGVRRSSTSSSSSRSAGGRVGSDGSRRNVGGRVHNPYQRGRSSR